MEPCFLTAAEAAKLIREKKLTSEALTRSCLERIEAREPTIRAFLHVDRRLALATAREMDKRAPTGPLHGIPVAFKDMIDTADMPTSHNSPQYQGHRPNQDAGSVRVVRLQGGVLVGKTDTVEFASGGRKAATRNPFNLAHTPGGSSSGSGAAVGDRQVHIAFGTQTGGSHIRPAAFNGIYGMKPSFGVVTREGAKQLSISLDTIGWYGRSAEDIALVAEAFRLWGMGQQKPVAVKGLRVAVCRTPYVSKLSKEGEKALVTAAERLKKAGAKVSELELPAPYGELNEAQWTIMCAEGGASFLPDVLQYGDAFHQDFRDFVSNKRGTSVEGLRAAYDVSAECRRDFDRRFGDIDVVLTPPAPGEAPEGLHTTGDWTFNALWTTMHVPCIAIPVTKGPKGLPVGVQIVGPRFTDARLIKIAEAVAPIIDVEKIAPKD